MGRTVAILAGMLMFASPATQADDSPQAQLARAEIYGDALTYVDRSLAANPGDPLARMLKGRFLIELGRNEEAIDLLQKLVEDQPASGEAKQMLALLYAAEDLKGKPRALLQRRLIVVLGAAQ